MGELELRRCEVLSNIRHDQIADKMMGTWKAVHFSDIKKGQIFRLFDAPGGTPLDANLRIWENGSSVCVALSDATPTEPEGNSVVESLELAGW